MKVTNNNQIVRHIATRVESLPFLRSTAAQHLERLQLLHDDVRALRGEILNLQDLTNILAAQFTHLCSTIDAKTLYEPQADRPESHHPLSVTNPDDDCQHIVDPIT